MEGFAGYVLTLTAASMICAFLCSFAKGTASNAIIRMLCGVFLTVAALSPVATFRIPDFSVRLSWYSDAAEDSVSLGQEIAMNMRDEIIKEQLEAYIQNKAAGLGMSVQARITLDANQLPVAVCLSPEPKQESRGYLEEIIVSDLGIPKEDQKWSG